MSNTYKLSTDTSNNNYGIKATIAQTLATIAQSFLLVGLGMELSMSTIVIQNLYQNSNAKFSLSLNEASWYGSILFIFHPTGSFLSGFLQERFGRKRCMIFANIPSIVGWIMLSYTWSTTSLYASSVFMGLSIGFSEAPILSYVGEITEPRLRGSMASLACSSSWIGGLMTFILGFLFEWRTVALISAACPVICICLVFFIPESPVWLVAKGKIDKAEKALCWLRGWVEPETVKTEHLELVRYNKVSGIRSFADEGDCHHLDANYDNGLISRLAQLKNPSVYRPLRLVMAFFFFSNIVSLLPSKPFFTKIMTEIGIKDNQSLLMVNFVGLQTIGSIAVMLSVHHVGKRFVSLFAFFINTILVLLFGVYILVTKNGYINSASWVHITLICGISLFGASVVSIPWMLISEIFPNKSRGLASGLCAGLSYLLMFVLTKSYLPIEMYLTLEYTIIVFGIISIFGLVFLYVCLPETENKTLLEIENFFVSN